MPHPFLRKSRKVVLMWLIFITTLTETTAQTLIPQPEPLAYNARALRVHLPSVITNQPNFQVSAAACENTTFLLRLRNSSGEKIKVSGLETFSNGNYLLTATNTSGKKGILAVIDNNGNLLFYKTFSIDGRALRLEGSRILSSGEIITAGSFDDGNPGVFLMRSKSDLTQVWQKTISTPGMPIKLTVDLFGSDKIAIAVHVASYIVHSAFLPDGSMLWSSRFTPDALVELVGFVNMGSDKLGLVSNTMNNGKQAIQVSEVNQLNGYMGITYFQGDGTEDMKAMSITSFNSRLHISGIKKDVLGNHTTFRNVLFSPVSNEIEHEYQQGQPLDMSLNGSMDNAGDAMGFLNPVTGQMLFIKHFADYYTTVRFCRQYALPNASQIAEVSGSKDGGYLFALNTSTSDEIILLKTDSVGTLAGCGSQNIQITNNEAMIQPNTSTLAVISVEATASSNVTIANTSILLNSQFDCRQNFCPTPPSEPECLTTYHKTFRGATQEFLYSHYLVKDNKQLLSTARLSRITGSQSVQTYGLKLLDEKGALIKASDYYIDGANHTFNTFRLSETRLLLESNVGSGVVGAHSLTLIDDDLQKLWTKTIKTDNDFYTGGLGVADAHLDSDGNIYVLATRMGFPPEPASITLYKLDASGNEIWTKLYEINTTGIMTASLTESPAGIIIVVEGFNGYSFLVNQQTGQMLSSYSFPRNWDGLVYHRFLKYENGKAFYAGSDNNSHLLTAIFDSTAKPIKLRYFNNISIPRSADAGNGFMYITSSKSSTSDVLIKLDTALNQVFTHEYQSSYPTMSQHLSLSAQGYLYIAGYRGVIGDPNVNSFIKKMDLDGRVGSCNFISYISPYTDVPLSIGTITYTLVPRQYQSLNKNIEIISSSSQFNLEDILCSSAVVCTDVQIADPGPACQLNTDKTIQYSTNAGCTIEPVWYYDPASAVLKSSAAGSAVFQFRKAGIIRLVAEINTGCMFFKDTMDVKVDDKLNMLSLGNDTLICPEDSIELKAGDNYTQYLWQDGTTGKTFLAKTAGKYYVTVSNSCGDSFADTIYISKNTIGPVFAGSNIIACFSDTVQLKAETGFIKYQWTPSPLVTGQGQSVKLLTPKDTSVVITGTTAMGCQVKDTVLISLLFPRAIHLGADTSICASDSLILDAGNGYLQYNWNNGSASSYTVKAKGSGTYTVSAKDPNGCFAKDTLIVSTYSLPIVDFGRDRNICRGESIRLDAGNYSSFAWNDGNNGRYTTINSPGKYWVAVTDANNCKNSDTLTIAAINNPPAAFLATSDSVCRYGKLVLIPKERFNSWHWSTGENSSSITIKNAGNYSLTVTDQNGCKATETIQIFSKDCLTGVYVPNAFTPNRDGHNDVFKALVYGPVSSFLLQVYNRYGEIVFTSNDPEKAWDGFYKGKQSDNGNYVWTCRYQFDGGEKIFLKGNLVLLR